MIDYIPGGSVDVYSSIQPFQIKQYDNNSHKLYLTIVDKDNPFGKTVNLEGHAVRAYFRLPDGSDEYVDCEMIKAKTGRIAVVFPGSVTQLIGTVECEISIVGGDGSLISLKKFSFDVVESIRDTSAIEATEKYSALDRALSEVQELINDMDAIAADVQSMREDVGADVQHLRDDLDELLASDRYSELSVEIQQLSDSLNEVIESDRSDDLDAIISEAQRLRSEVNSLVVSSSSGSGEGGSEELRNVRIGYDGTEYETAGIAVREQIKALNDMIVSTEDFLALFGFDDAGDVAVELAKPVISGVSSSTNSITVRWNTVANAQYYTVERRTVNSDWAVIASDYTGTSYLDADVAAGTNYQYAITACRSDGSGGVLHSDRSYASVTIAIEDTTVPVAPASVVATAGNNYITVQWSAVSNANYYVIRRKTAGSSAWTTLSSGATGTGYTDRTAAVGTGYQYGVVACRKSASGNVYSSVETVSNTATIEDTSAADEAPSAPANVTAYWNANEGRVYVSWSSVSGVSYTLERKEGDDAWEELSLTNSNFYEDSNVTAGTNYQYRVIAHKIGSSGQTLDSDPVTVSAAVSGSNADGKTTWGDTSKISAAQQVVDEITVGWNLANSLDATYSTVQEDVINTANEGVAYETRWGNPKTTPAILRAVRNKGFNAIRIPVTWNHHLREDANGDMYISEPFLNRVKELVDMALDVGFNYVIINTHHDASDYSNGMNKDYAKNTTGLTWQVLDTPYRLFAADASMSSEEVSNMYARTEELWGLIATAFKEYDYRLIFEGFNEILGMSRQNWDNPKTSEPIIQSNELNNAFIRGVRNAGGAYNPTRVLSCQHYGGQAYLSGKVVKGFDVTDSAGSGYIILQIHYYMNTPSAHKAAARDNMEKYPDYPLIFGEIGWNRNSNSHLSGKADGQLKNGDGAIVANSLYDFCEETVRLVAEQGAKVFWWDNARWSDSSGQEILGLLNRSNATWYREGAADGLVAGANALSNNSGTSGNNSGSSGSSGSGSSTGANTSTEQENITLSSPANVAATAGSGSVTVTWGRVSGASRYKLERSSDNGSSWTTLLLYQTDTGYTDSTVTAGTTYKYRVTAYSSTGGASNGVVSSSVTAQAAPTVVIGGNAITSPETAAQVVSNITVGWNLGNTLDCTTDPIQLRTSDANKVFGAGVRSIGSENEGAAYETSWGDAPVTTQEMLEAVVAARFNAIRIPVTWGHHLRDAALPYDWGLDVIDRGDYSTLITEYPNLSGTVVISPFFLKRVKEVVNMALNAGFEYVILNTHHETADYNSASSRPLTYAKNVTGLPWLTDIPYQLFHTSNKLGWRLESVEGMTAEKDFENMCDYMHTLWTLIAKEFKDYDYRLIFEGFNEMLNWSRAWDQTYHAGNGNEATTTQLQRLNAFNNTFIKAVRNAGGEYNRKRVLSCETFGAVTTDFILEPFSLSNVPESFRSSGYCLTDSEISSENSRIILQAHYYNNVAGNFQSAAQRVVAKGLPAIFGEVGWHTDSSAPSDLYNFGKNLVQQAKSEGVKVFWWDNNKTGTGKDCYGMLNRWNTKNGTAVWDKEALKNGLIDGANAT